MKFAFLQFDFQYLSFLATFVFLLFFITTISNLFASFTSRFFIFPPLLLRHHHGLFTITHPPQLPMQLPDRRDGMGVWAMECHSMLHLLASRTASSAVGSSIALRVLSRALESSINYCFTSTHHTRVIIQLNTHPSPRLKLICSVIIKKPFIHPTTYVYFNT